MPPARQQQPQAMVCDQCESTFFYTVRAEEFVSGGYGSAEFRSISGAPKTIYVCMGCGKPVTPKASLYARGTQAAISEEHFASSIKSGEKFRQAQSMSHVAEIAASPAEVEELRQEVEDLRKALKAMHEPKAPQPKAKVKKTAVPETAVTEA